jgi:hypothetical protein
VRIRIWDRVGPRILLYVHFFSKDCITCIVLLLAEAAKRNMGEIGPDLVEWMVADDLVGLAIWS